MAKGDIKADPRQIIRAHRESYVDARTGRRRPQDFAIMEGLPLAVAAVCIVEKVHLASLTGVGLLTTAGLLSAFLFGAMLQVSDRAMTWADLAPEPGRATSDHATYLSELAANAGYASLVSIATAVAFVVASATTGWPLRVSSGLGIGLSVHLTLTLFMVMKRVFALTLERLTRARTGADRTDQRRAS